jgi:hypothetical protein
VGASCNSLLLYSIEEIYGEENPNHSYKRDLLLLWSLLPPSHGGSPAEGWSRSGLCGIVG